MNKKGKFIVFDATDIMCIGGFGNDKGNIELLKYSEEEISNMIIENNNSEDNIRLVNSLLGTIRKQKEVIDKAIEWVYIVQQNKDNKHLEPIICTDELDEVLDILKGADND